MNVPPSGRTSHHQTMKFNTIHATLNAVCDMMEDREDITIVDRACLTYILKRGYTEGWFPLLNFFVYVMERKGEIVGHAEYLSFCKFIKRIQVYLIYDSDIKTLITDKKILINIWFNYIYIINDDYSDESDYNTVISHIKGYNTYKTQSQLYRNIQRYNLLLY